MRLAHSILGILLLISASSCTKRREAELRENLAGTWQKNTLAFDENNDGLPNAREKHTIPSHLAQTVTFGGEGNGTFVRNTLRGIVTSTFTWAITDSKHITTTATVNGKSVETEYEITRLKGNELTFKTSTPSLKSDVAWEYYTRR